MTDTEQLSDFDLMVLVAFETKAESEGSKPYTFENWTWKFEDATLNERAATFTGFMGIVRENAEAVDAWWNAHPSNGCDLLNAHHDEVLRREDNACLWAAKRNDGRVFPEQTRERAEYFLNSDFAAGQGLSFTLLQRDVPGGEWREVDAS